MSTDPTVLTRTRSARGVMSRGEQEIAARLQESAAKLAEHERMANAERVRRDLLVMKLIHAGCSERKIGDIAGVSGEAVHYIKKRWEKRHAA